MDKTSKQNKDKRVSFRIEYSKVEYLKSLYCSNSISEIFTRLVDERINSDFSLTVDKPPIKAMGGKHILANRIIEMIPHHKIYVEPFANTAAVMLRKAPSKVEVYNDINGDITNLYSVIKEQPIALYNLCKSIPYSEQVYREIKGYSEIKTPAIQQLLQSGEPIHKAVLYFYLSHAGWMGGRGGYGFSNRTNYAKSYSNDIDRIIGVSERIKNIDIQNGDYRKIINRYAKYEDAFFFIDPPYLDSDFYYDTDFGIKQHKQLAEKLLNIKGKFLICHYSDKRFNDLYKGCYKKDIWATVNAKKTVIDENGVHKRPRKVLRFYANYQL